MLANVDMSAIREALARRAGIGGNATGGVPMISQLLQPGGTTPTGGSNVLSPTVTQPNPTGTAQVPPRATQSVIKTGQAAQSPLYDEQTRALGKALVERLIKAL